MKKTIIIMLIAMLFLAALALAAYEPGNLNAAVNVTYLGMGESALLSAQGYAHNYTDVATYKNTITLNNDPAGITTNSTTPWSTCCLFVAERTTQKIMILNSSGYNVGNISVPAALTSIGDLWTNASNSAVTDFWVHDYTADRLYHLTAAGALSADPIGNFSTAVVLDGASLTSNVSSGTPTHFYIANSVSNYTAVFNATGTNVQNITLDDGSDAITGFWTNASNTAPVAFWGVDVTDDKLYMYNATGSLLDSWDIATRGLAVARGLTGPKNATNAENLYVSDSSTDDNVTRLHYSKLNYAILSTNETGAWANKSDVYSSPMYMGNATIANWSNFTWSNSSLCNAIVGWQIYYNDTYGRTNTTGILTFTATPYVNATSYGSGNITAYACEDKNNMTLTMDAAPAGRIDIHMPYVNESGVSECTYWTDDATITYVYNLSQSCWLRLNHSAKTAGDTIKVYKTTKITPALPPNLPAALTAAIVGIIVISYVVTRKSKRISWS